MCVSALILSTGITFSYAELAEVAMRDRYAGLNLPNLIKKIKSDINAKARPPLSRASYLTRQCYSCATS